jgi:hypothetical protein
VSSTAVRTAAAAAALVLAGLSRGDALVLAGLLALAAWRPLPAAAGAAALAATAWRWSSASLEDIAGAQAVLGPAGWVGPGLSAAGAWLGALALLAATPVLPARAARLVAAIATGAAAAVVVVGPAPGGAVWARVVATVVGSAVALVVAQQRSRGDRAARMLDAFALLTGVSALLAIGQDAGTWAGILSASAVREGSAVAVAAAAVVLVAQVGRDAMEQRRT